MMNTNQPLTECCTFYGSVLLAIRDLANIGVRGICNPLKVKSQCMKQLLVYLILFTMV